MPERSAMEDAVTALTRFGWGVSPGAAASIKEDPRGHLFGQLGRERPAGPILRMTSAEGLTDFLMARRAGMDPAQTDGRRQRIKRLQGSARSAAIDRLQFAMGTPDALADRLVAFWSNHFAVSNRKQMLMGMVAGYEEEAIRPHVFGRFGEMLAAVVRHPAMLIYLDNQVSVGPNSKVGRRRDRGLNENLGRELLELHTLGAEGGYDQGDVREIALALTGWRFVGPSVGRDPHGREPGTFRFQANMHEPGERTLLGQRYAEGGEDQVLEMLRALSVHPSTARHVATKLARHFVADRPPDTLVDALERTFMETEGDLLAMARVLIGHDASWAAKPSRFLPPLDFVVATQRAFPETLKPNQAYLAAVRMGQRLWAPAAPEGYGDGDGAWLGPEGLKLRLDLANRIGGAEPPGADVPRHAEALYGGALDERTSTALRRAEAARQGYTLLMMSPRFLRR